MATQQSTVEYRDVPGFPGYRVGNDGSVWTSWDWVPGRGRARVITDVWRPKKVDPRSNKDRRAMVKLHRDGRVYNLAVYRLVLLAFVGPCPPGMEACHYPDPDPANNALSNLRWDTHAANVADSTRLGNTARGERVAGAKLTAETVRAIRSEYAAGNRNCAELGRKYGVSRATIERAVARVCWKHVDPEGQP